MLFNTTFCILRFKTPVKIAAHVVSQFKVIRIIPLRYEHNGSVVSYAGYHFLSTVHRPTYYFLNLRFIFGH